MTPRRQRLPGALSAAVLLATLLAGCGSTARAAHASSGQVHIVCHTQSLTVELGSTVLVSGCPAGTTAAGGGSGMGLGVTTGSGPSLVASTVGTFTVSLDRHPVCTPGRLCPDFIVLVAVLQVHVTS